MFSVEEELVHLGRGADNQIALSDESLEDHQASIIRRNGRYAIFTPIENGVEVDGNGVPAEQWVWLPETSQIQFGKWTLLQFRYRSEGRPQSNGGGDSPAPPARPKKAGRKRSAKPTAKKGRKVARFITDTSGDQLVRLGEDGQLPELALTESNRPAQVERKKRERSPALLYGAVVGSLALSLLLLVFNPGNIGTSADERADALRKIARFYGEKGEPKPYQRHLREARQARWRGDVSAERRAYQRVLDLLNSEDVMDPDNHTGLTGDKKGDGELRRLIGILMDRQE
ncbi:MAG: FHA domain-containing protein [Planctomycetaceae bacterium]